MYFAFYKALLLHKKEWLSIVAPDRVIPFGSAVSNVTSGTMSVQTISVHHEHMKVMTKMPLFLLTFLSYFTATCSLFETTIKLEGVESAQHVHLRTHQELEVSLTSRFCHSQPYDSIAERH